jgi:hypothetical protein
VPEQRETQEPPLHAGAKAPHCNLRHHYAQPNQSGGDVQSMAADKGEKRRQESAALRACASGDHVGEFTDLKPDECGTEDEGNQSKGVGFESSSLTGREQHHSSR